MTAPARPAVDDAPPWVRELLAELRALRSDIVALSAPLPAVVKQILAEQQARVRQAVPAEARRSLGPRDIETLEYLLPRIPGALPEAADFTAAELIEAAAQNTELESAIRAAIGLRDDGAAKRLERFLARGAGRDLAGYRLVIVASNRRNAAVWRIAKTPQKTPQETPQKPPNARRPISVQ